MEVSTWAAPPDLDEGVNERRRAKWIGEGMQRLVWVFLVNGGKLIWSAKLGSDYQKPGRQTREFGLYFCQYDTALDSFSVLWWREVERSLVGKVEWVHVGRTVWRSAVSEMLLSWLWTWRGQKDRWTGVMLCRVDPPQAPQRQCRVWPSTEFLLSWVEKNAGCGVRKSESSASSAVVMVVLYSTFWTPSVWCLPYPSHREVSPKDQVN